VATYGLPLLTQPLDGGRAKLRKWPLVYDTRDVQVAELLSTSVVASPSIPSGTRFADVLDDGLRCARLLLVLIGRDWLICADKTRGG
jgi:hypothetical protein